MKRRLFLSTAVIAAGTSALSVATAVSAQARPLGPATQQGGAAARTFGLRMAGVVPVSTVSELRTALTSAVPGDTITVANGSYAVPASAPIAVTNVQGTAAAPVTVVSASRGGAVFTSEASFVFSGSAYVTVSGFSFRQSTTLEIAPDNHHIRLTRNDFQFADIEGLLNVMVRADDTKIDRNHFHGKSTLGVYLGVEGAGTTEMAQRVYIFRNYFSDHSYPGDNGGEPIRLGVSPRALSSANATVEFNLFERCNGDPEAISVKSSDNTIRYNTIRNSKGGIVLRHGNRNRIDGNFLLDGPNGVRIYGNDHLIVNNHLAGVSGAAVVIGKGTERDHLPDEDPAARRGNDAPDRVQISLNTLVSNASGIIGETSRPEEPRDLVITDNVIVGDTGLLADVQQSSGFLWKGNLLWGAAANGNIPTTGFSRANPGLTMASDGIARPGAGSPVINAASRSYPLVPADINGVARVGIADLGSHEVGSAVRSPLSPALVGPNAA
ncbi:polysaccharide lyase 6 family protein [Psychromicrobium xiongbiense]|uniref:polysaccharide lyase 6 family protein n=1 Tax=Psychromicrobium xiongbiense TaxID=3051184 RepID=UPI002552B9C2|nr:polysaccharide lyase 6 family protein [Psychromicrobium sp. YIM S02556]